MMTTEDDRYNNDVAIAAAMSEDFVFLPTIEQSHPFNWIREYWIQATEALRRAIRKGVIRIAVNAATYPWLWVVSIIGVSIGMMVAGMKTNFYLQVDLREIFTPTTSRSMEHQHWALTKSGLPGYARTHLPFVIVLHAGGDNVISYEGVDRVFEVWELVTSIGGLNPICMGEYDEREINLDIPFTGKCDFQAISRFWNHSQSSFEEEFSAEDDITPFLLNTAYPDGTTVDLDRILGNLELNQDGIPLSAEALFVEISVPLDGAVSWNTVFDYTAKLQHNITALRKSWTESDDTDFVVEFVFNYNIAQEFTKTIFSDFPLLPFAFSVMLVFTSSVFWKWNRVQSRLLLALGSVVTIVLSMTTGFGLMFIFGVPYTIVTTVLPYVVFGIGLDDTYIIYGSWERTNPNKPIPDRVRETFEEVGLSITMTTLTTSLAFALGCISTIPAIRDLCFYAFPMVLIDGFYQVSFFVSLLALDERRIKANRRDCCLCCVVKDNIDDCESTDDSDDSNDNNQVCVVSASKNLDKQHSEENNNQPSASSRIMGWYADQLLRPCVRMSVILGFAAMFCGFAYRATFLQQNFSFYDLLPTESPTRSYLSSVESFGGMNGDVFVYFRGLNQSDPVIQDQMIGYLDQIADIDHVELKPFCFLKDIRSLMDDPETFIAGLMEDPTVAQVLEANPEVTQFLESEVLSSAIDGMTFDQVLNLVMSQALLNKLYSAHIRRDANGEIQVSRCVVMIKNLDYNSVNDQIELLAARDEITANHPLNQNAEEYNCFLYKDIFHLWEFLDVVIQELRYTSVVCITSVTAFGLLFMPHWSATLYLFPFMVILYIDLLGMFQVLGLTINVLTYVTLVVAVGLLVDFLMHTMLKYYESSKPTREDRVRETLTTMGASIMLGAVSTFLGSVPLLFSQSAVFRTLYKAFFAMISLGLSHGLILLPAVLSLFGTEVPTAHKKDRENIKITVEPVQSCRSEPEMNEDDHTEGSSSSQSGCSDGPNLVPSIKTSNENTAPGSTQLLNVDYVCQPSLTYDQCEIQII